MTRIATTLTIALAVLACSAASAVDAKKTVTKTRTKTTTTTLARATTTVANNNCRRAMVTPIAVEPRDEDDEEEDTLEKRAKKATVHVTVTKTKTKALGTKTVTADCAARTPTLNNAYDTQEVQDLVGIHNAFRSKHGARDVVWNETLAQFALSYASQCNSGHSGHPGYGENLAWGAPPSYWTDQLLFNLWADEGNNYNYNNNNFDESTGHFTQVVWKGTTSIGCATVSCPKQYMNFGQDYKSLTCEYYPQGNVQGQFVANVGRPQ